MATRRRQRFIHAQAAWMLTTLVALAVLSALTLELFFAVSFLGLLVVIRLTKPFQMTPRWRWRLKWVRIIGWIVFGVIVARRILAILAQGVL